MWYYFFDWLSWLGRGEHFRGLDLLPLYYDSYYPLGDEPVWVSGHYRVYPLWLYDRSWGLWLPGGVVDPVTHDPYEVRTTFITTWPHEPPRNPRWRCFRSQVSRSIHTASNIWVFLFPAWLWWLGASILPLLFSAPVFLFALRVSFCDATSCRPPQATLSFSMKLTPFHHCILNCFAKWDVLWTLLQNMVT